MFDLIKFNPWLIGLNLIMWGITYILVSPTLAKPYYLSPNRKLFSFCMLLLFTVCAFWGSDWFHIYDKYNMLVLNNWRLESVYHWIAANLASSNYFLWRLIVWGSASTLVWLTFTYLNINRNLAIALFLSIWMIWFSYARVSLSMSLAFWGFALIHTRVNRFSPYFILGFVAIISSFYFHKSASFAIACCLIVTFFPFLNRRMWIFILILFPLLVYYAQQNLSGILLGNIKAESKELASYVARGQEYLSLKNVFQGIGYLLGQLLERIPYYMLAITSFRIIVSDNYEEYSKDIIAFMKLLVLIIISASIFLFDLSMNTQLVYERFMRFSFIPACVVLTYCLDNEIFPKWHKCVLYIAISGSAYQLIYMLYCSIMN